MSQDDDIAGGNGDNVLVAEYVLGLLDAAEHERVRAMIAADPALQRERALWQTRFAALNREYEETPVPAHILAAVEARAFGDAVQGRQPSASWWNSLPLWRGLTAGALAVAVVAVGFSLMRPTVDTEALATQLVAALSAQEGSGVEFVALYDTATGSVRLLGLSGEAEADQDYELWYIRGDEPAVSMGVIPGEARTEIPLDDETRAKITEGTILAVTLEQKGGSPTGVAQGPIVSVGTAQPI